jgi:glycosyltransferase involved in cell wall biosynthesis
MLRESEKMIDKTQNNSFPGNLRIAIVHDWLPLYGGAERVLEQMLHVLPNADLFSMIDAIPEGERQFLHDKKVTTSVIQKLPFAKTKYRGYLPLMPLAVEQFDLSRYDIVISSSYAVAKGVLTGPDQLHVCYCHSPIRYGWDLQHEYLNGSGFIKGWIMRALLHYVRLWDTRTANGVDKFVANSRFISRRIRKAYGRNADVIYPPVNIGAFNLQEEKQDYYLTASRLVPYKKIDLVVEAFAKMPGRELRVIGDGPEWAKIAAKATPNVKLLGYQENDALAAQMRGARAFIFPAQEDFGIVPVEAQACGTPVIGYARGGSTETVVDGVTGVLVDSQTPDAIRAAVCEFENRRFEPVKIRQNAERFSIERFRKEFSELVENAWGQFCKGVAGVV